MLLDKIGIVDGARLQRFDIGDSTLVAGRGRRRSSSSSTQQACCHHGLAHISVGSKDLIHTRWRHFFFFHRGGGFYICPSGCCVDTKVSFGGEVVMSVCVCPSLPLSCVAYYVRLLWAFSCNCACEECVCVKRCVCQCVK